MDVQVRYWHVNTSMTSTCYFDTQFLVRPYAQNLLDCLVQSINSLPVENFIQLSINGPTANWPILNNLVENQKRNIKFYGPFLWMGFSCLKARATSRRQFIFYY